MEQRAAQYDQPAGERSMAATVAAFNAVTGRDLTEADGWLMMVLLKLVRDNSTTVHEDSLLDAAAYVGLYGEARLAARPENPLKQALETLSSLVATDPTQKSK